MLYFFEMFKANKDPEHIRTMFRADLI